LFASMRRRALRSTAPVQGRLVPITGPQRFAVIKLGAVDDIVQAFRAFSAIRLHHDI